MYEQFKLVLGRAYTRLTDLKSEEGQGITEYGIAVAFVVVALAGILYLTLGGAIGSFLTKVGSDLNNLPGNF